MRCAARAWPPITAAWMASSLLRPVIEAFARGEDIHTATAVEVLGVLEGIVIAIFLAAYLLGQLEARDAILAKRFEGTPVRYVSMRDDVMCSGVYHERDGVHLKMKGYAPIMLQ